VAHAHHEIASYTDMHEADMVVCVANAQFAEYKQTSLLGRTTFYLTSGLPFDKYIIWAAAYAGNIKPIPVTQWGGQP
jgi:hypothetical protein